jgi:hypothetical protein
MSQQPNVNPDPVWASVFAVHTAARRQDVAELTLQSMLLPDGHSAEMTEFRRSASDLAFSLGRLLDQPSAVHRCLAFAHLDVYTDAYGDLLKVLSTAQAR